LPVVGSIAAGPLGEALQHAETFAEALRDLLPFEPGDFLLEVRGDSMIGDGIYEGDRVLLRPNIHVQNGEIAAVHVGDEYSATLKPVSCHLGRRTRNRCPHRSHSAQAATLTASSFATSSA
jgi:repressor LexA